MERLTIFTGAALIFLGVGYYIISKEFTATAYIPPLFGLVFILLSQIGKRVRGMHKHANIASILLAIMALFSTLNGFLALIRQNQPGPDDNSTVILVQGTMFIICFLYIFFAIRVYMRRPSEPGD